MQTTEQLSALITKLEELVRKPKPKGYSVGEWIEFAEAMPFLLPVSRWALEAKEALENLKKDGAMFSKHDDAVVVALSSFPSIQ